MNHLAPFEVLRWCEEYIERDRRERFQLGDKRADAAMHLILSIQAKGLEIPSLEGGGSK